MQKNLSNDVMDVLLIEIDRIFISFFVLLIFLHSSKKWIVLFCCCWWADGFNSCFWSTLCPSVFFSLKKINFHSSDKHTHNKNNDDVMCKENKERKKKRFILLHRKIHMQNIWCFETLWHLTCLLKRNKKIKEESKYV